MDYPTIEQSNSVADLSRKIREQEEQINSLTQSVQKYKNLFNNSNNAIFIVDFNGNIIEVNDVACKRYGYNNQEFSTLPFIELILESEKNLFDKSFRNIETTNSKVLETIHFSKEGAIIPVELVFQNFDLEGKNSILIIAKDISERLKHEKELENERDLLKALMDNIPDTIYFKDQNSKFIRVNKAQSELLGIDSCDEAVGKTDFDFFKAKHAKAAFRDEEELFRTKTSLISKAEHIKLANGKSKWVTATKVPVLDKMGNVSGLVGMSRDITELKNAETKIQKYAKELQYLNSNKDKFFSILAHDLKNPFFSLLGYAEMLEKSYEEFTDEERLEYVHNIISISKRSYQLLENLLEWAGSQNGRIEYQPVTFNLGKLVNDALYLINPLAINKSIGIINGIKGSLVAYADTNMIRTVLRNLVTNALKFTDPRGTIQLNAEESKHHIKIIVQDNGKGMDSESLKEIFRNDVNHKSLGTLNEEGTGLGLIICKEFVEKNGGQINVESTLGEGSKFIFTIPKCC